MDLELFLVTENFFAEIAFHISGPIDLLLLLLCYNISELVLELLHHLLHNTDLRLQGRRLVVQVLVLCIERGVVDTLNFELLHGLQQVAVKRRVLRLSLALELLQLGVELCLQLALDRI